MRDTFEHSVAYHIECTSIDNAPIVVEDSNIFPVFSPRSFEYIVRYVRSGHWADEEPDYQPCIVYHGNRESDALNDAQLIMHDTIERKAFWAVAHRCTSDPAFADAILEEATRISKTKDEYDQKELKRDKRYIRAHIKDGDTSKVYAGFCSVLARYRLYKITDFSFEERIK